MTALKHTTLDTDAALLAVFAMVGVDMKRDIEAIAQELGLDTVDAIRIWQQLGFRSTTMASEQKMRN